MNLMEPLEGGIYCEELGSLAEDPGKGSYDSNFFLYIFASWTPYARDPKQQTHQTRLTTLKPFTRIEL